MKRKITFLIAVLMLLTMINLPEKVLGQKTPTTIWSEDFSSYSANDVPSGGTYSYVCTNGTYTQSGKPKTAYTKIWEENIAGGTSPELLVARTTGGSFSATIPLDNYEGTLTLTYYQNTQSLKVSSSTNGVSGGQTIKPTTAGQQTTTFTGITTSMTSITIVFETTSGNNVRLDNIVLTGTQVSPTPSYTITTAVNDENMGSVALNGSIITATPNTGYRVSSSTPYSISPENSATIVQNGNQFTVTPSANTTVTINFEAIPSHTLSSAVSPAASAGTVTLGSTSILEGATTTATAGAESGYKFTSWSISGTGASLSSTTDNPTTVTMGSTDATVTANFAAVTTYAIKWSVNGEIQQTDNVEENTAVTFPTSITGVPSGYVLKGWVIEANKITGSQDTPPTYVTEANATANITYYAVMAVGQLSSSTETLELESTGSYTSSYSEKTFTDDKGKDWTGTVSVSTQDQKPCISMSISSGTAITSPTFPGTITKIKMLARNGSTKYARTFNFNSAANNNNGNLGTLEVPASFAYDSELTATLEAEFDQFYLWVTDNLGFNKIAVTYNETIYSNYCTSVSSQTAISGTIEAGHLTTNGTIAENTVVYINTPLVINSDVTLTVNGALTTSSPTDLIIEEGGQLIIHNDGVQATVKKAIEVPTKTVTNWYTIASPVANITLGAINATCPVVNLKAAGGYDLYRYNEAAMNWENYKNAAYHDGGADDFVSLEAGRGYLYRRDGTATLEYTGEVNGSASVTYSVTKGASNTDIQGFNLIGNPYSHDIYKGKGGALDDTKLNTGYYRLNNDASWGVVIGYGTPIKSGEGFLVQANTAGDITIYNNNNVATGDESKSGNDYIQFNVANGEYTDVAYALFQDGFGLNKINHRNPDVPMIYINQNNEDFAIAMMKDDTKSFNLNFKPMTMGKYTLSYKAEGDFNYLHVIDRLTGEDVDMLLEDEYSFISAPGDNENRFIVRLGYMPNNEGTENEIFAYQNGSDVIVSGDGELQVFDVTGRMVATQRVNGVETINIPSQGVYIFKLNEKVQKIVVR